MKTVSHFQQVSGTQPPALECQPQFHRIISIEYAELQAALSRSQQIIGLKSIEAEELRRKLRELRNEVNQDSTRASSGVKGQGEGGTTMNNEVFEDITMNNHKFAGSGSGEANKACGQQGKMIHCQEMLRVNNPRWQP